MRFISNLRQPLALVFLLAAGAVAASCAGSTPADLTRGAGPGADGGPGGGADVGGGGANEDGFWAPQPEVDSGPLTPDAACAGVKSEAQRLPVYMLIVLDGSGSMSSNAKWASSVAALSDFFSRVAASSDLSFGLGMTVFSDSRESAYGGRLRIQVPIRFVDAAHQALLTTRLTSASPSGGTPTLETMRPAYTNVAAYAPEAPLLPGGKKVIVLISDGVPNGGTTEQTNIINLARQQANLQPAELAIATFSMGVGLLGGSTSAYDPKFMAQVAVAGGTARAGCDVNDISNASRMCHFQLTPGANAAQLSADFLAAIQAVRGMAASCEYSFTVPAGQQLDPNLVSVSFTTAAGTTEIPKNAANGWQYDNAANPTKVILLGTWCEQVKAATAGKVEVVLGCAPRVN